MAKSIDRISLGENHFLKFANNWASLTDLAARRLSLVLSLQSEEPNFIHLQTGQLLLEIHQAGEKGVLISELEKIVSPEYPFLDSLLLTGQICHWFKKDRPSNRITPLYNIQNR